MRETNVHYTGIYYNHHQAETGYRNVSSQQFNCTTIFNMVEARAGGYNIEHFTHVAM